MMRTAAFVLLIGRSLFLLMHSFQASLGESVQWSRDDVACSSNSGPLELTDVSGWFTSPNYPENYPRSTTCRWLITSKNTAVSLDFTDFYTEERYDTVRVYNGNTTGGILFGEYSGRIVPPPTGIHTVGPQLLVIFYSNYIGTFSGFNATYTSSDYVYEPDPCHPLTRPMVVTDFEGTFQSGGFPEAYPNFALCLWVFVSQVPDGIVRLEFDVFQTQAHYDKVRVYDGTNNNAPLLGELHGSSPTSKVFYSTQQYLHLQFSSDLGYVDIGFNGTYQSQARPTTTAFPPGLCGTNLHVSPSEATIPSTHDLICHLDKFDYKYLQTNCSDLIQNLPGIGNADELIQQGGNFGCYSTREESYGDASNACYDNYQWSYQLGICDACTRLYVCIRFQ